MTEVISSIARELPRGVYRAEMEPKQPDNLNTSHALALGQMVVVMSKVFPDQLKKSDYDLTDRFMEHFQSRRSEVLARSKR